MPITNFEHSRVKKVECMVGSLMLGGIYSNP